MVAVSDAHERSIGTDLLLGLLKKVQRVRRDLRVVIITTPPTAATFRWAVNATCAVPVARPQRKLQLLTTSSMFVQCLLLSAYHAPGAAASVWHSGGLLAAPGRGASPAGAPSSSGEQCERGSDSSAARVCDSPLPSHFVLWTLQVHYLEESVSDYVRSAVDTAVSIHRDGMPGDILLLLPGGAVPAAGSTSALYPSGTLMM